MKYFLKKINKLIFWFLLLMSLILVGVCFAVANSTREVFAFGGEIFTLIIPLWLVAEKIERMKNVIRIKNRQNIRLEEENKNLRNYMKEEKR